MRRFSFLTFIALVTCGPVTAQNIPKIPIPPETTAALDQIDKAFDLNLKGWTRERYTPFQPSSGLAERWQTPGRSVRVFIAKLGPLTADLFKNPKPGSERLEGICEEALVSGYDGDVFCSHGGFGISINSSFHFTLYSKDEAMNRSLDQAEAKATSRLIACFINLALDGKLSLDWPHARKPIFQRPCEQELMMKGLIGKEIMGRYSERY
jgi:hypothetical protein